ncbi:hypothetical protein Y032_0004g2104 [Ancylostoma ceylanicum]|uniref:Uncharacterized protein n=1 Tax=Ancylostoma ceylanicum TaxID=53326 RepID=A0A016VVA1_9BILA|nr:hypothetical protein Y032_0004g2104 [Ancylostoma ceylanicum]
MRSCSAHIIKNESVASFFADILFTSLIVRLTPDPQASFRARFARVAFMWHFSHTIPAIPHLSNSRFLQLRAFWLRGASFPQLCNKRATSFLV